MSEKILYQPEARPLAESKVEIVCSDRKSKFALAFAILGVLALVASLAFAAGFHQGERQQIPDSAGFFIFGNEITNATFTYRSEARKAYEFYPPERMKDQPPDPNHPVLKALDDPNEARKIWETNQSFDRVWIAPSGPSFYRPMGPVENGAEINRQPEPSAAKFFDDLARFPKL